MNFFKNRLIKSSVQIKPKKSSNFNEERPFTTSFEHKSHTKNTQNYDSYSLKTMNSSKELYENELRQTLLSKFDELYLKESEAIIDTIEESRQDMKNTILDFYEQQSKYKKELLKLSEDKYTHNRRKENAIPLSEYMKKKSNKYNNVDSSLNDSVNSNDEIKDDYEEVNKKTVDKYIRKRDRQKLAEKNLKTRDEKLGHDTELIIGKIQNIDINLEKERDRQAELLKHKLKEKKDQEQMASHILENYHEVELRQEKERQAQKEKLEADLNARKTMNNQFGLRKSATPVSEIEI